MGIETTDYYICDLMEEIDQKGEIIRQLKNLVAPLEARIKRLEGIIKFNLGPDEFRE